MLDLQPIATKFPTQGLSLLVVAFGFCPKIVGGGGDLQMMVLVKNECSLSGGDNHKWWGHSTPT